MRRSRPGSRQRRRRSGSAASSSLPASASILSKASPTARFRPRATAPRFRKPPSVDKDFALMAEAGINTVRVFTVPPVWLLDAAQEAGLKRLGGAALAAARHLSRQSGDPGGDQGSGRRRGARLRAASGDFRLSRRQRDPAGHDPLARRRAGTAVSARASSPRSGASTRRRSSATPISRRPNT